MKRVDLLLVLALAVFFLALFVFAGAIIPLDYNDSYVVDGVDISFKSPGNFTCGGDSSVYGCATVNGSEMRLSSKQGFLEVYTTCNHEMVHVRGVGDHSDFSFMELTGFRPTGVCGELVFGKII